MLIEADMFIWDESPMAHKYLLEAFERSLRALMNIEDETQYFANKIMILGGDFRQTLPFEPGALKPQILDMCIKSSRLWHLFTPSYKLTINKRAEKDAEFCKILLEVGNGEKQALDEGEYKVPDECISNGNLKDEVFGDAIELAKTNKSAGVKAMYYRKILNPYNSDVIEINNEVANMIIEATNSETRTYISIDEQGKDNTSKDDLLPTEVLNTITANELPLHEITLFEGAIVILIRNINLSEGLSNGTCLVVKKLERYRIEAEIISECPFKGKIVTIPRISLESNESSKYPKFIRHQFPLKLAYALTINKSQGQTLDFVGLDLSKEAFAHGHLYTGMSRAQMSNRLKILIDLDKEESTVKNIVYKEVLED